MRQVLLTVQVRGAVERRGQQDGANQQQQVRIREVDPESRAVIHFQSQKWSFLVQSRRAPHQPVRLVGPREQERNEREGG